MKTKSFIVQITWYTCFCKLELSFKMLKTWQTCSQRSDNGWDQNSHLVVPWITSLSCLPRIILAFSILAVHFIVSLLCYMWFWDISYSAVCIPSFLQLNTGYCLINCSFSMFYYIRLTEAISKSKNFNQCAEKSIPPNRTWWELKTFLFSNDSLGWKAF